jgi:regulator of PEP synthase PpsR (kinase-PPPase family)
MPKPKKTINISIISDATGATAQSVLTSVLVQFKGAQFNIERYPFTRTRERVTEIIDKIPARKGIIVFTMVKRELREYLIEKASQKKLTMVDVMGPLMSTFTKLLKRSPKMTPGAFRQQDEEMYRLTEAIHYTLLHDDGMGLETIDQADLIILGVSRTGKTPTSIYLSCRKLKVANIPVILDVAFPMKIARLPIRKVGFRISYDRLLHVRSERARRMAVPEIPGYTTKSSLIEELDYCDKLYQRLPGLLTLDVTNRSIEETAEWITRTAL